MDVGLWMPGVRVEARGTASSALAVETALNGDNRVLTTRTVAIKLHAANFFTLSTPLQFPR